MPESNSEQPHTTTEPRLRGREAESLACRYLIHHGLKLVTTNFLCRRGEIDLVMRHGEYFVFVEVRLRNNPRFGSGAESVDHHKQKKLILAAQYYLQCHHLDQVPARFDVVAINRDNGQLQCHWIQNAFSGY